MALSVEELRKATCKVLQPFIPSLISNREFVGKLDEKIRKLIDFISEKNYRDEITKQRLRKNLCEAYALCCPSLAENKREKNCGKIFKPDCPPPPPFDLEDCIRAGFDASLSIE